MQASDELAMISNELIHAEAMVSTWTCSRLAGQRIGIGLFVAWPKALGQRIQPESSRTRCGLDSRSGCCPSARRRGIFASWPTAIFLARAPTSTATRLIAQERIHGIIRTWTLAHDILNQLGDMHATSGVGLHSNLNGFKGRRVPWRRPVAHASIGHDHSLGP